MMIAWTFSFYKAPIFYFKCVAAGKRETTQRISDRNRLMHFVRYIEFQTDSSRLLCVVVLQLYKALNIALYAARSYISVLLDDAILILLNDLSRKIGLALQTSTWSKESSTLCIVVSCLLTRVFVVMSCSLFPQGCICMSPFDIQL